MEKIYNKDRFIVSVKVGPKGQITIPVEARRMFDIQTGDTLMMLGDLKRGIVLMKDDLFYELGIPKGGDGGDGSDRDR